MYYIENKLTDTTKLYDDIDSMLMGLNIILSEMFDETSTLINIERADNVITYKSNQVTIISNDIPNKLQYLIYFVLHKKLLLQHLTTNITPEFLLNVFTSKKCIADPYNVLLKILNIANFTFLFPISLLFNLNLILLLNKSAFNI